MKKFGLRAPSPALIISVIALFVALGGTTYAAAVALPVNSVGTPQIKNLAVTSPKIANASVTAAKINPAGLTVPNSNAVGGVPLAQLQKLVTGSCSAGSAIRAVAAVGTVTCQAVPNVFAGAVNDTGSAASFYLGGSGMTVSWVSTGVTQISIPSAGTQPILSVTAVGADSTQHCVIGSSVNSTTYQIRCYDGGSLWPTAYHVYAIVP